MVLLTGLQWLVLVVWVTKGFFSIDEGACGGERRGGGLGMEDGSGHSGGLEVEFSWQYVVSVVRKNFGELRTLSTTSRVQWKRSR